MPRLMVDTNVLLDLLSKDRALHGQAQALFMEAIGHNDNELFTLASSLKDVYYLIRRHYGSEAEARCAVSKLVEVVSLLSCDGELVQLALDSDEPDFEDGLVRRAAERVQLDGIVTRDKAGFLGSAIPKLTVSEAVDLIVSGR